MNGNRFDVSRVGVDTDGRVVLNDTQLEALETELSFSGGTLWTDWESDWYLKTNPSGCTNQAGCEGDKNTITCNNEIGCRTGENGVQCSNAATCTESTNRVCTNTFVSGCAGSTNTGGQQAPCS